MSFNKIIIVGNLGKDPELRKTPQGKSVCEISVATNERRKNKAGVYEDLPTWFRVTLWEKNAENASRYLKQGSPIYVEGRLSLEEWTDRDGAVRQTLEVRATEMHFIGGARDVENVRVDEGNVEEVLA
jgi:single-strand DNA-binding protein